MSEVGLVVAKFTKGGGAKPDGHGGYMVRCPGHDDDKASLHIWPGDDQPVMVKCFADCPKEKVLAAVGLTIADLCNPTDPRLGGEKFQGQPIVATYDYVDEHGELIWQVIRTSGKIIRPRVRDAKQKSGWDWRAPKVEDRVLYRLPKVIEAIKAGKDIWYCYAPDTEVLTPRGWVVLPDLEDQDVAQYSPDGSVQFVQPVARQELDHDGDMVSIQADWSALLVTPDHRVLTRFPTTQARVVRADQVGVNRMIPVAGVLQGRGKVTPDQARLIAAWQADGVDTKRGYRAGWNLKKGRKVQRIHALLDSVGVAWKDQQFPSTAGWTYVSFDRRDTPWLPGKTFDWPMLGWSVEARVALLDELGNWDGDRPGKAGVRFFTADRRSADVVSALAATSGWGSILRVDSRSDRPEQADQYVVSLVPRSWRTVGRKPTRVPYSGKVYCLTVPSSFLVTRRHGKVTVAGNCEGEKDVQSLERAGVVATTASGGASSWFPHYADSLRGAQVTIVADKDDGGRSLARQVRAAVIEVEGRARIVEAASGKDATDHLQAGGTLETFVETVPYEDEPVYEFAPTLDEYLDNPPGEQKFVVPGLLAEREVALITGGEGAGKSSLLKQIAVMVAAGLHPFTTQTIPQRRVLLIDLENPKHDNYSDFAAMRHRLRKKSIFTVGDYLHLIESGPMDVRSSDGLSWLLERVHAHKPDLLIIGPIYNMVSTDLKDEDQARALKSAIDLVRARYGCAVILEHHAPHRSGEIRDMRPIGSSLLMRWPAFGFGLSPIRATPEPGQIEGKLTGVYEWYAWRGARRRERKWPTHLRWGNSDANSEEWPWETANDLEVDEARASAGTRKRG